MLVIDKIIERIKAFPIQREILLVSEWASQKRYLPEELTPDPGWWRNERTPYLVEIMDCLSETSEIRQIAIMKAAQLGLSTGVMENGIGYSMDCSPCPMMFISADAELAKTGMALKIDRMIASIEGLQEKLRSPVLKAHGKNTGDTVTKKEFAGGYLIAAGARSPGRLRAFTIKRIFFDEVDGYPLTAGSEGDPISLAEARTRNYATTKKKVFISTPTILQISQINVLYEEGDKRKYYIPCTNCGEYQTLEFFPDKEGTGLHFDKDENKRLIEDSVYYQCKYCKGKMVNAEKTLFLGKGEWRPEPNHKPINRYTRSYHLNALYSPWFPWEDIVELWLKSFRSIEKMKVFYNTVLGLPWEERGETPVYSVVASHRRMYPSNTIPNEMAVKDADSEILLVTAAVDTQDNGLFIEVRGWCEHHISWSISWEFLEGDTRKSDIWQTLKQKLLEAEYKDKTGRKYAIQIAVIDAGGHRTKEVYRHCQSYPFPLLVPIMGDRFIRDKTKYIPWQLQKPVPGFPGLNIYRLNTTWYKDELAENFKKDWEIGKSQPNGYMNFPEDYTSAYFKQYTAEEKILEKHPKTGQIKIMYWKQIGGRPNHAFDCAVYNLFALEIFAYNLCTIEKKAGGLGLDNLDWGVFWQLAKKGYFYEQ